VNTPTGQRILYQGPPANGAQGRRRRQLNGTLLTVQLPIGSSTITVVVFDGASAVVGRSTTLVFVEGMLMFSWKHIVQLNKSECHVDNRGMMIHYFLCGLKARDKQHCQPSSQLLSWQVDLTRLA
jgi:hypothetical protein